MEQEVRRFTLNIKNTIRDLSTQILKLESIIEAQKRDIDKLYSITFSLSEKLTQQKPTAYFMSVFILENHPERN